MGTLKGESGVKKFVKDTPLQEEISTSKHGNFGTIQLIHHSDVTLEKVLHHAQIQEKFQLKYCSQSLKGYWIFYYSVKCLSKAHSLDVTGCFIKQGFSKHSSLHYSE